MHPRWSLTEFLNTYAAHYPMWSNFQILTPKWAIVIQKHRLWPSQWKYICSLVEYFVLNPCVPFNLVDISQIRICRTVALFYLESTQKVALVHSWNEWTVDKWLSWDDAHMKDAVQPRTGHKYGGHPSWNCLMWACKSRYSENAQSQPVCSHRNLISISWWTAFWCRCSEHFWPKLAPQRVHLYGRFFKLWQGNWIHGMKRCQRARKRNIFASQLLISFMQQESRILSLHETKSGDIAMHFARAKQTITTYWTVWLCRI